MKIMRKIIEIDREKCDGCGLCVPACAEGAIAIVNGKAEVIRDPLCDGLGACIGECPQDALHLIEREAEPFDEADVHAHLSGQSHGGCPSAQASQILPSSARQEDAAPCTALGHWPIQIRLVPPTAPFLKNADLLILADCAAVADPRLHHDLLPGKVVMMGCPKFDDANLYIEKFTAIFRESGIRSITVAFMEVPCCGGLPAMVKEGLTRSGATLPLTEVVIQRSGDRGRPDVAPKPPLFL